MYSYLTVWTNKTLHLHTTAITWWEFGYFAGAFDFGSFFNTVENSRQKFISSQQ